MKTLFSFATLKHFPAFVSPRVGLLPAQRCSSQALQPPARSPKRPAALAACARSRSLSGTRSNQWTFWTQKSCIVLSSRSHRW